MASSMLDDDAGTFLSGGGDSTFHSYHSATLVTPLRQPPLGYSSFGGLDSLFDVGGDEMPLDEPAATSLRPFSASSASTSLSSASMTSPSDTCSPQSTALDSILALPGPGPINLLPPPTLTANTSKRPASSAPRAEAPSAKRCRSGPLAAIAVATAVPPAVKATKATKATKTPRSRKRSTASAGDAANPAARAHALRRQKHNEIELRRRERMKQHFAELDALCAESRALAATAAMSSGDSTASDPLSPRSPSLSSPTAAARRGRRKAQAAEKKDKDGILVHAIDQIRAYRAEIERLREAAASAAAAPAFLQLRVAADGTIVPGNHGANFRSIVHPDDVAALTGALRSVGELGARSTTAALRLLTARGDIRLHNVIISRQGPSDSFAVVCAEV